MFKPGAVPYDSAMEQTFLQSWARVLVLLHAAAAIVLVGSTTHHLVIAVGYLRRRSRPRLGRIYAATSATAYGVTFLLGALAYPTFRYHVRGLYLDRHAPWASNLFDLKEDLASLGLPLVLATFILSRLLNPKLDRPLLTGYAMMVLASTGIVWFNVVAGLLITLAKGV